MSDKNQREQDLVEEQGVNAGPPIDEKPRAGKRGHAATPEPPTEPRVEGNLSDEMAGLPEQKPGTPGQQRSVDTS